MKKVLSLVLVVLMVAGLSASAFAAETTTYAVLKDGIAGATAGVTTASATGKTSTDESEVYIQNDDGQWEVKLWSDATPGDVVAIEIVKVVNNGATPPVIKVFRGDQLEKKEVEKQKVFFDATKGSFAEGPVIEQIKISPSSPDYIWAVTFKLPDPASSVDIIGDLAIAKTSSSAKNATYKYALGLTVGYDVQDPGTSGTATVDNSNSGTVYNFKSEAGEVDIEFGKNGEIALYNVEASSQGKVNLKYSTKFNADVAAKYPNANIDFLSFVKSPSFNKTGTLYIYADKDTFLYEVTADGLKAVNATYDESYEAWKFKTRTLGAYAISDAELKLEEKAPESSEAAPSESAPAEQPNKTNPGTGR